MHSEVYDIVLSKLKESFSELKIGDPMDRNTQVGPLISEQSFKQMQEKLTSCRSKGLTVTGGDRIDHATEVYVTPAIVETNEHIDEMHEETFAPILYVMPFTELKDAVNLQNSVKQGLSLSLIHI